MFVDASTILAILVAEPEGAALAAALDRRGDAARITSVVAAWEAAVGLYRKKSIPMAEAEARVRDFLKEADVRIVPLANEHLEIALQAFERYGRHRYSEAERNRGLNLADCFHYACAKANRTSILHKDPGFALTDVPSAFQPS